MTRTAFLNALVCLLLALGLVLRAWRSSRRLRAWLRAPILDPTDPSPRAPSTRSTPVRLRGVLEGVDDTPTATAPFSERRALWVRARLRGPAPAAASMPHAPTGTLWEKQLSAPARIVGLGGGTVSVPLDHARLRVYAACEYRHGVVRTLTRISKVAARALVRAGYTEPPPPHRLFTLEEEVLQPGDEVLFYAVFSNSAVQPGDEKSTDETHPLWVTNLSPLRIALRLGWASLLSLWLAFLCVLAATSVLAAWLVAR